MDQYAGGINDKALLTPAFNLLTKKHLAIAAIMSISGHKIETEFRKYTKKHSVRLEIVAEQISSIKGINFSRQSDKAA